MSADQIPEIPGIDGTNLYKQEAFTDLKVGTLQRLTPIQADGTPDESRATKFIASTSLMTPSGALPVQADIDAKTIAEAIEKSPEAMKAAIEKMITEAREMEQKMRSQIVVPKGGMPGGGAPSGLELP